ncbi:MAG: hypothetical protein Q8Q42_00080 [Nanoarchaeota archaeon]|nr:hypothetical protein [Nanoarchaeota archaeon]
MNEGDKSDVSEEDFSGSDSKELLSDVEYIDEDGNPVDKSDVEEGMYEYAEEYMEEPITPEHSEVQPEEPKITGGSNSFEDVYSSKIDLLEKSTHKNNPIENRDLSELQKIAETEQEKSTADEILKDIGEISGIPLSELTKKYVQENKAEEVQPEDHSEILLKLSNPRSQINTDTDELIRKAQESHEEIEKIRQEHSQIQHIPKVDAEIKLPTEDEKNEDLFRKLTMKNPVSKPQITDNKEEPYVYNNGHPHIGTTFSMDTISSLTRRLFNSDEAVKKLNKNKKA